MRKSFLHSNQSIANYRLISLLGLGRSGEVWASLQEESNDIVALKVYRQSPHSEQCSLREFEMAGQVRHPNILSPITHLEFEGLHCIVMPLCEGRSLDNIAGYMKEEDTWMVLRDISSALHALHQQHLVHHDIKPSNILLHDGHYYLSDFGSCHEEKKTIKGDRLESDESSYMYDAPEVIQGQMTTASDIWSLGATVFHLLMGSHVFNGMGGRKQHEGSPLPYMRKELPELSELVCQCLSFMPSDRPSAQAIAASSIKELDRIRKDVSVHIKSSPLRPKKQPDSRSTKSTDFWPEEMI